MIRVLVSSCLLGEAVRYHGGDACCESEILDRSVSYTHLTLPTIYSV